MAKKCKFCNSSLPSGDKHSTCLKCRNDKKGDDPCVKGKSCKFCESVQKSVEDKKRKMVDDSILDEEDNSKGTGVSNLAQDELSSSALNDTLKTLLDRVSVLTDKVSSMESASKSCTGNLADGQVQPTHDLEGESSSSAADAILERQSDTEEGDGRSESLTEKDPDPSYIEMLQAVKSLLELPEPEFDTIQPPTAFKKKPNVKASKRQMLAFPPDEDVHQMWQYRHLQATGKDTKGKVEHAPLHAGHFLPFSKINMSHYLSIPQLSTLKAPQCPESFFTLGRSKTPSTVSVPWKFHLIQERIARENVQILERVVFFKRALAELCERVRGFTEDAKEAAKPSDLLDMVLTSNNMQERIITSMETALETVLSQTMSQACNFTLARRDALLKDCHRLSSEDQLALRNAPFVDTQLFPSNLINHAENNILKRAAVKQSSQPASKKPRRDQDDFKSSSYNSQSFRNNNNNNSNSSSGRGRSATYSRGSFRGGRGGYGSNNNQRRN